MMRRGFRRAIYAVGAASALLLGACTTHGSAALQPLADGKEYANAEEHYTIAVPASWCTHPRYEGALFTHETTAISLKNPHVFVRAETLPAPTGAADLLKADLRQAQEDGSGFEVDEEHRGRVNGSDAAWTVGTTEGNVHEDKPELKHLIFVATAGKTVVRVLCAAPPSQFERVRSTFEGICGSLKITP
jgi:hypothetical protein